MRFKHYTAGSDNPEDSFILAAAIALRKTYQEIEQRLNELEEIRLATKQKPKKASRRWGEGATYKDDIPRWARDRLLLNAAMEYIPLGDFGKPGPYFIDDYVPYDDIIVKLVGNYHVFVEKHLILGTKNYNIGTTKIDEEGEKIITFPHMWGYWRFKFGRDNSTQLKKLDRSRHR